MVLFLGFFKAHKLYDKRTQKGGEVMKKIKTYIGLFFVMLGNGISKIGYRLTDKDEMLNYITKQVEKSRNQRIKGANVKFWGE